MILEELDARARLSALQSSIHDRWESHETNVINCLRTPGRNQFYGATDALWDMDDALRGAWNGLPSQRQIAKLTAYGILQALVTQQDAVESLCELILPDQKWKAHAVPTLKRIRTLRIRLSGHVAYARSSGRTASIINVDDPMMIAGTIYGLSADAGWERFPREPIRTLITENASGLTPTLQEIDAALSEPEQVFGRLRAAM